MKIFINRFLLSIIIFFSFLSQINNQKIDFRFNLRKLDENCFSEYFPDKTLVIYNITSTSKKMKILFKFENDVRVGRKTDEFFLSIITEKGGNYEICITNLDKTIHTVNFSLKYGVGAKDYSSIPRAKDLKPVDLALEKLSDKAKDMSKQISFSQRNEKIFESFFEILSSKVVMFSFLIIICMILVGYYEIIYLKNFMRRRKII